MSVITEKLTIEGMSCGHCVAAVRQALSDVGGVQIDQLEIGSAVVRRDEDHTKGTAIEAALREAGYELITRERL